MSNLLRILFCSTDTALKKRLQDTVKLINVQFCLIQAPKPDVDLLMDNDWDIIIADHSFFEESQNELALATLLRHYPNLYFLTHLPLPEADKVPIGWKVVEWKNEENLIAAIQEGVKILMQQAEAGIQALIDRKIKFADFISDYPVFLFNLLDAIYQSSPVGIVITDMSRQIILANKYILSTLGYSQEELLQKRTADITHPDHKDDDKNFISRDYLEEEARTNFQIKRFIRKDGTSVWAKVRRADLFIIPGYKLRLGIMEDITLAKAAEEETQNALLQQRELNDLKSRFVSMASHEFRTPLTSIQTSMELLSMYSESAPDGLREKIERHHNRIFSDVERLTGLMNDFLVMGKLEAQRMPFRPQSVDIELLAKSVIDQLTESAYFGRNVEIVSLGTLKEAVVDPTLMAHILNNLISNALKYSADKPDPIIRIGFQENNLEIQIQDFGIGIPQEEVSQLYNSFFRASNTSTIEGTGLGMVIVKNFMDLHQGEISIQTQLNQGTTFSIKIPQ